VSNKVTLPCGCQHNEKEWITLCIPHKKEFDMRHAAAVESCSHVARNKNIDLVS
jgi:hypothetical protein